MENLDSVALITNRNIVTRKKPVTKKILRELSRCHVTYNFLLRWNEKAVKRRDKF